MGIYIGGTGSSNHLEDYEEGSWTPAVEGASGLNVSQNFGRYRKIGNLVVVSCRLQFSASGNDGGSIGAAGLPFSAKSGLGENYTSGGITYCNLSLDANRFHPYVAEGQSVVKFYEMNSGAAVNISGSFSNKYLGFSAHYFT